LRLRHFWLVVRPEPLEQVALSSHPLDQLSAGGTGLDGRSGSRAGCGREKRSGLWDEHDLVFCQTSYVGGDQFNQYGDHNIGKIDQRSGSTVNAISVTEKAQAIAELAEFIDYLEKAGLISASGQLVDVKEIESEVVRHESRLRKVAYGLAAGATRVLSSALDHVAAPVILKLIESHLR